MEEKRPHDADEPQHSNRRAKPALTCQRCMAAEEGPCDWVLGAAAAAAAAGELCCYLWSPWWQQSCF